MTNSIRYFMAEVSVADLGRSTRWYGDVLGLRVVLEDQAGRFALLDAAGGGRVALKEMTAAEAGRGAVRLVFEVGDLEGMMARLAGRGVAFEGPTTSAEGYREIKLADPDGTPIGLFAWADAS